MKDYINIGSSPCNEKCAQVGDDNYREQSRKECLAFIRQIERASGEPPDGAVLIVKSFEHDFGTYREVVCYYDDDLPESQEYAFRIESEAPSDWDEEARKEIGLVPKVSQP